MISRRLVLGTLMAAAMLAACSERGPTALAEPESEMATVLPSSGAISGQVVSTVRRFDDKSLLGTVVLADTGSYEGAIGRGRVQARATSRSGSFDLMVAMTGSPTPNALAAGDQRWSVRSDAPPGVAALGVRSATYVAKGGAPASEATYSRGAEVVATVSTTWVRVQGGWLMKSRTLTAFKDGRPTASVETRVLSQQITAGASAAGALMLASTEATAVGNVLSSAGPGAASEEAPCQAEFDAMFDALDRWWYSTLGLAACSAGPLGCFGAAVNLWFAGRNVDVREARLDRCIGGAQ